MFASPYGSWKQKNPLPSRRFYFRAFYSQWGLAGVGCDRVQPDPRRRGHRVGVPRQNHHRDHPPAADRGPAPPRQIRQKAGHPPTKGLALAGQLGRTVRYHPRLLPWWIQAQRPARPGTAHDRRAGTKPASALVFRPPNRVLASLRSMPRDTYTEIIYVTNAAGAPKAAVASGPLVKT